VNTFINRLNARTTVSGAAIIIAFAYLLSRLLGLLRDRLLVSHFGISPLTDAYTAAFRLPELLFTLLVSGAFAVAFIPVFTERIQQDKKKEAWELASILLNWLSLATLAIGALAFVFAGPITTLVAPGFDPERHQLTVDLTRIMLITPFLFALSSLWGGIAQSYNRFVIFSLASVFYNLGIIFGILFLSSSQSIYGVAYGVVIGAALQAALQIAGLAGLGYRHSWRISPRNRDARKVLGLMIPRSIDQGIDQISYVIETIIGSRLVTGSLTSLYYANNLKNVPLALIGASIATAAFPRMAARAASGAIDQLKREFVTYARLILFFVIPAAIITILMRGYIVRLLYGFGDATTANTLGWFAGVIVFQALFFLITRMFYALKDTRTPLYASLVAIGFTVALSFALSERYGVMGLAMAQSIVVACETLALAWILNRRLGDLGVRMIWRGLGRMLIAGAIMGGAVYIVVARVLPLYAYDIGFTAVGPKFFTIMAIAAITYLIPCYLLDLREARMVWRKLKEVATRPLNLT
jgi:putative peptidoglycan lipid II flippase